MRSFIPIYNVIPFFSSDVTPLDVNPCGRLDGIPANFVNLAV